MQFMAHQSALYNAIRESAVSGDFGPTVRFVPVKPCLLGAGVHPED